MNDDGAEATVSKLVAAIERTGLAAPARIVLDAFAPLDVISCQIALFTRPFTTGSRWSAYADALSDVHGWQALRALLARGDC
ncbi:MAG: hypothetical protein H7Y32_14510 [Chloroflexales bacterium]|nr:hypothetical protein [Chloroflexales bacterium]